MRRSLDRFQCLTILGIKGACSKEEIRQAYHDLVKVWHPDRFTHDPALALKAQEKLKEVNEAYDILKRLPEQEPRRTGAAPQPPSTSRRRRSGPFWEKPSITFILVFILSAILFKIAFSVFRATFHNPTPGKSVRDVA